MTPPSMRVSFYQKNPQRCPVCAGPFKKEEMLSGGGRLIAMDVTDELRRMYRPSKKVGEVHPLSYPVTVCPHCYYASFQEDFAQIPTDLIDAVLSQQVKRKHEVSLIFPSADFSQPRDLISGTASYLLAISCYAFQKKDFAPTFKKAIAALRSAWLLGDLHAKYPDQLFDRIQTVMYRKAMHYYQLSVRYAETGEERMDTVKNYGPDLDKNYGYEGVLFMSTLLLYKYGDEGSTEERIKRLERAKLTVSKVFGSGKSSKAKPSAILDLARDLYDRMSGRVDELKDATP
jgi:uncharacterized protein (DUF2225 family)